MVGSPATIEAYCRDLATYIEFLDTCGISWRNFDQATIELLGRYSSWLDRTRSRGRRVTVAPNGEADIQPGDVRPPENVVLLNRSEGRASATVSRMLAAVYGLYGLHTETPLAKQLERYQSKQEIRQSRRWAKRRPVGPRVPSTRPQVLTLEQVDQILGACLHLRDRLFVALCAHGFRMGAVLGLRHSDWNVNTDTIVVESRDDNENGARAKRPVGDHFAVPVLGELTKLYCQYLSEEYGFIDSDYIFLNLFSEQATRPLTKSAVRAMVGVPKQRQNGVWGWTGLRGRSGVYFRLHWLRHTFATDLSNGGMRIESIGGLLGHRRLDSTSVYMHPTTESLRGELAKTRI